MKYLLILGFILFLEMDILSQKKNFPVIFNEFSTSVIRTFVVDENTDDRWGAGLNLFKSWRDSSMVGFGTGISLTSSSQFKDNVYVGRFGTLHDLTYRIWTVSIPISLRLNFGSSVRFFWEGGVLYDRNIVVTRKIEESQSSSGVSVYNSNIGPRTKLGVCYPIKKIKLLTEVGYYYGLFDLGGHDMDLFNRYGFISIGVKI